ncbi:glycoside hydrolase family 16 protein [Histomonas meleagridis]|uniref:glycoside hydrolase family 16 protein n=1 Tax=Histomonas meleagridis TaxID=135588 RepID=UPI00355A638D|nr:glycoside hydrolase family 16 protein [Histomonas meleagridis]KAH0798785.1 glycoside hydrolase family 16 protein [Histomonas meleagridis]
MFLGFLLLCRAKCEENRTDPLFEDFDIDGKTSKDFIFYGDDDGNYFTFGETDDDGSSVVKMTWNGKTKLPDGALYVESNDRYSYGHLSCRIKNPDSNSQPNAGIVTSLFMVFNSKEFVDIDGDGIKDTNELDIEFLAAAPNEVHFTVHNNYDDNGDGERISRNVNIATGESLFFRHIKTKDGETTITDLEAEPFQAIPDYSNTNWNVYGIDYFKKKIVMWLEHDGKKVTLFEITSGIPQAPMYILGNIWWTDSWYPGDQKEAVERPTFSPTLEFDWIKWEPCTPEEDELYNKDTTPTHVVTETAAAPTSGQKTQSSQSDTNPETIDQQSPDEPSNWSPGTTAAIVVVIVVVIVVAVAIAIVITRRKATKSSDGA